MAEGVGFEPTRVLTLPVFKTGAFVHSAIPPRRPINGRIQYSKETRVPNLQCNDKHEKVWRHLQVITCAV